MVFLLMNKNQAMLLPSFPDYKPLLFFSTCFKLCTLNNDAANIELHAAMLQIYSKFQDESVIESDNKERDWESVRPK